MGDLDQGTRLERLDQGRFRATLSGEWNVLAPAGGYLSALALRAGMEVASLERPASYLCHYLNPASEGEVELLVEGLRASARAESVRVSLKQSGRLVLEALVWAIPGKQAIDHDTAEMPEAGPPESYQAIEELAEGWPPFQFWRNFDYRPVLLPGQTPYEAGRAATRGWLRFRPTAAFGDQVLDAMRSVVLADIFVYPASQWAHPWPTPFFALSLDLAVTFHGPGTEADWLLVDAEAPIASAGVTGGLVRIWTREGALLATSVQQMLQLPR